MKKMLFATVLLLIILMKPSITFAQNVMGNWTGSPSSSIDQTAIREQQAEEQEGQNQVHQRAGRENEDAGRPFLAGEAPGLGWVFFPGHLGKTAQGDGIK